MIQVTFDCIKIADASAQLNGDLVKVIVLGIILNNPDDVLYSRFIDRFSGKCTIQIDQMKPSGASFQPV